MANELEFKRWFRTHFNGWSETYEPRHGSGLGMPDVQLLIKVDDRWSLMPVEIKLGWIAHGRLWIEQLRPAQVGWHVRFMRAGGEARLVVGVKEEGDWTPWVPPWDEQSVITWKLGWDIGLCKKWHIWA